MSDGGGNQSKLVAGFGCDSDGDVAPLIENMELRTELFDMNVACLFHHGRVPRKWLWMATHTMGTYRGQQKRAAFLFFRSNGDEICRRLAVGESLRSICRDDAMPGRQTVADWLARDHKFFDRYTNARLVRPG